MQDVPQLRQYTILVMRKSDEAKGGVLLLLLLCLWSKYCGNTVIFETLNMISIGMLVTYLLVRIIHSVNLY